MWRRGVIRSDGGDVYPRGTQEVLLQRKPSDLGAQGKAVTAAPCASSLGRRQRRPERALHCEKEGAVGAEGGC